MEKSKGHLQVDPSMGGKKAPAGGVDSGVDQLSMFWRILYHPDPVHFWIRKLTFDLPELCLCGNHKSQDPRCVQMSAEVSQFSHLARDSWPLLGGSAYLEFLSCMEESLHMPGGDPSWFFLYSCILTPSGQGLDPHLWLQVEGIPTSSGALRTAQSHYCG